MEGAIWVLLVALLVFAVSLLIHHSIDRRVPLLALPLTWFYASWLLALLLLALPLFRYHESFSANSSFYIISVLTCYAVGSIAAAFWQQRKKNINRRSNQMDRATPSNDVSPTVLWMLLAAGLAGSSLLLLNAIRGGELTLAARLSSDSFAAIRSGHMTATESNIGLLYGPANLISALGGLGVAYTFYLFGSKQEIAKGNTLLFRASVVVLFFNMFVGFIGFGSRMFAVFALLVAILSFTEGRWAIGERVLFRKLSSSRFFGIAIAALMALSAIWFSATFFLERRVEGQDPQSLLYRTHRAHFTSDAYVATRSDPATQYFLFSVSYLTTPLPTLTYYLDLPDSRQPGPFYGQYNFPAPARWIRRLTFTSDPFAWERARFEIFKPLAEIQFGTNVWASMVRDLVADFGKIGALCFLTLLGFFAQRIFDLQAQTPTARRAGLLVYLRLVLLFAGLISILFQPQIHWPLYLAIAFVFFAPRGHPALNKHPAPSPPSHGGLRLSK